MIIEVTGVSTRNKGAELMLLAVKQHFEQQGGTVQLAVSPLFGSYRDRAVYGLLQKVEAMRWGRSRIGFSVLPKSFRAVYGMVTEQEIDAVIDAAGFAFGDQHPLDRTLRFARDVERWKSQGKRVVLLPQALGPFENPQMREGFRRIVAHADLIYARDEVSLQHAREASDSPKIRLAPDITIGITVRPHAPANGTDGRTAYVVPNSRMMDKVSKDAAGQYVPFLQRSVEAIERHGLTPKLLLHDTTEDHALVELLRKEMGRSIEVVREPDPLRLKALLGQARLMIGSRFHSLVGALSQATPAVAVGWSHKYNTLMSDFGCPELVLSPADDRGRIEDLVGRCVDGRDEVAGRLLQARGRLQSGLERMWQEVDALVGVNAASKADARPTALTEVRP